MKECTLESVVTSMPTWETLEDWARLSVQGLLQRVLEEEVTELLGELSLARLLEGTNKELGWLVHPHPTISEMVKEAALAADGEAIHI